MTRRRRFQLLTVLALGVAIAVGGAVIDRAGGPWPTAPDGDGGQASAAGFDALFRSGVGYLERSDPASAMAAFENALALRPEIVEARVNLGYALLGLSMHTAAENAFRTAIDQQPRQVNAYFGLAESLEALDDMEGALGAMRTFVHLSVPGDPYRRRASAAIWEWEAALAAGPSGDGQDNDGGGSGDAVVDTTRDPLDQIADLPSVGPDGSIAESDRDGKIVVLNIWATWCAPCRRELPQLQALSERLDASRAAIIGLSIDEDIDLVREFLRDLGVGYPNHVDSENRVAAGQLDVQSYPQTIVFGPDGTILRRFIGAGSTDGRDVVDAIESVVGSLIADIDSQPRKGDRS